MHDRTQIQEGMPVVSQDGEPLGHVARVDADGFTLEVSERLPDGARLSYEAVQAAGDAGIVLALTRQAVVTPQPSAGMREPPRSGAETAATSETFVARGGAGASRSAAPELGRASRSGVERAPAGTSVAHVGPASASTTPSTSAVPAGAPTGPLGLGPRDLEEARMDSAKFQDHGAYRVGRGEGTRRSADEDLDDIEVTVDRTTVREPEVAYAARDPDAEARAAPGDVDPEHNRR